MSPAFSAKSLVKATAGGSKLAPVLNEYASLYNQAGRDSRAYADALDAKDEARQTNLRLATTQYSRREAAAVGKFDQYCHGK